MSEQENTATENSSMETPQTVEPETGSEASEELSRIANLEEEVNKLKMENSSLKDSWLRERAEFQNYKRRTANEYMTIKREAVKSFVLKMLNPIDNLDRVGAGAVSEELKPFMDGINMIKNEVYSILQKENIQKIEAVGKPFDPMCMEAIAAEESEDYKEEVVLEVYQAGYQFVDNNEKYTLRPARVRVGRPKF